MNSIDTSTTGGKIEVMRAAINGEKIEYIKLTGSNNAWRIASTPCWDWSIYNYRIAPKLAERQPLGPADFPPGTVISWDNGNTWVGVAAVRETDMELANACAFTYCDLIKPKFADNMRRSLDGGKTWLPCYK